MKPVKITTGDQMHKMLKLVSQVSHLFFKKGHIFFFYSVTWKGTNDKPLPIASWSD